LTDIEAINRLHTRLVFAEMAQVHCEWFARYEPLYRPRTASAIREGQQVSETELTTCRASREHVRTALETVMKQEGVDLWVSPAAPGTAPEGIASTGSPLMNLPWTHAGMPAMTLPSGHAPNGLPLGLQFAAATMADEKLLSWAEKLADCLTSSQQ
jgi:Asp-tRNA(Asn)/Glu-tRNA(Gln) amidotransferase A subunit family amidase